MSHETRGRGSWRLEARIPWTFWTPYCYATASFLFWTWCIYASFLTRRPRPTRRPWHTERNIGQCENKMRKGEAYLRVGCVRSQMFKYTTENRNDNIRQSNGYQINSAVDKVVQRGHRRFGLWGADVNWPIPDNALNSRWMKKKQWQTKTIIKPG